MRASAVTREHDVCSSDPWVEGYVLPAWPLRYGPAAYHPNECGMRAIAEAINAALPPVPYPR